MKWTFYHEYLKQGLEKGRPDLWSSGHLNPSKESMAGCDTQEAGEQGENSTSFGDSWPQVRYVLITVSSTSNLAHPWPFPFSLKVTTAQ